MPYVKSINGTSSNYPKPTCKCGNWLEHWETNRFWPQKRLARFCRCCGKEFNHNELNGGHVIKTYLDDRNYYIVPLCNECNNYHNDKTFCVKEEDLVSANCSNCRNN